MSSTAPVPSTSRSSSSANEAVTLTQFEAVVGLIMGGVSLMVALGIGVRWVLKAWNREDD